MAHDVFLSYSSQDKPIADAVCGTLEGKRIRCWIAPRDVLPGLPYGEAIVEAIESSRVMVLVFSANSNTSPQVMREVERAVSKGIPILPLRIEQVLPSKSLEHFISSLHWLDALTPPLEKHLQSLAETVQLLLVRHEKRCDPSEGENGSDLGTVKDIARTPDHSPTQPSSSGQESSRTGPAMKSPTGPVERAEQGPRSTDGVGTLPSVRRRLWLAGMLGAMAAVVLGGVFVLWLRNRPAGYPTKPTLDLRLSLKAKKQNKDGLWPLDEPNVLPLQAGDALRIEARTARAAYFYVLNLTADGKTYLLYPWHDDEDWNSIAEEKPRDYYCVPGPEKPPDSASRLAVGPSGIESVVVLVRETPLTATERERLRQLFQMWPVDQGKFDPLRAAVLIGEDEFRFGDAHDLKERGKVKAGDAVESNDPVLRLRRLLQSDVRSLGVASRGVCYTFQGK
jgi:hypothetical protein